ncbi:hypothetical protein LINPERHAP1_LOCUS31758 [Linum perenne]
MQQTAAAESPSDRRSKAVALSPSVALAAAVLRPPSPSPSFPASAPSSNWARRRGYLKNRTSWMMSDYSKETTRKWMGLLVRD